MSDLNLLQEPGTLTGIRIKCDRAIPLVVLDPKRYKTYIFRNGDCIDSILMARKVSATTKV